MRTGLKAGLIGVLIAKSTGLKSGLISIFIAKNTGDLLSKMSDLEFKVSRHYCSLDARRGERSSAFGRDIAFGRAPRGRTVPSGSGKLIAVLALKGIWDSLARGDLEQTTKDLLAENIVNYIFDLSEVTRAESTGIGFLIKLLAEVQSRFGGVVVIGASERLKTACDFIGLWGYVSLADDLEHALKLFLDERHRRI